MPQKIATLSLREHPFNGTLRRDVKFKGPWPEGIPIIFIHGFNTNEKEGLECYRMLTKEFQKLGVADTHLNRICHFFWPGNKANAILSKFSYPLQIGKAKKSAALLAKFLLREFPTKKQFVFIAHSLGCRLVMEAICEIQANPTGVGRRVSLVALMAAAIPVDMLKIPNGSLYYCKNTVNQVACLHSSKDSVLRNFFVAGQRAAFENSSHAVGLYGFPKDYWSAGRFNIGIDHNDYWKNENVVRSLAATLRIPIAAKLQKRLTPVSTKTF